MMVRLRHIVATFFRIFEHYTVLKIGIEALRVKKQKHKKGAIQ